jgi:RNA polymerase sigma-70 factor (ECF subfamily)
VSITAEGCAQSPREDEWTSVYENFAARLIERAEAEIGQKLSRLVDPYDVVQSAFRTLIRRARDPQTPMALPPGTDLWRLLLVITLNKIRRAGNHHRAAKRSIDRTHSITSGDHVADDRAEDPNMMILRMTLEEQLDRVEPLQRRILALHLSGAPIEEIAEQVNRSPRTVYRTITGFQDMLEPLLNGD